MLVDTPVSHYSLSLLDLFVLQIYFYFKQMWIPTRSSRPFSAAQACSGWVVIMGWVAWADTEWVDTVQAVSTFNLVNIGK